MDPKKSEYSWSTIEKRRLFRHFSNLITDFIGKILLLYDFIPKTLSSSISSISQCIVTSKHDESKDFCAINVLRRKYSVLYYKNSHLIDCMRFIVLYI
jgi:hypothetical protein